MRDEEAVEAVEATMQHFRLSHTAQSAFNPYPRHDVLGQRNDEGHNVGSWNDDSMLRGY